MALGEQPLEVAAPATFRSRPGETVWLSFTTESLRLYDAETALALEAPEMAGTA